MVKKGEVTSYTWRGGKRDTDRVFGGLIGELLKLPVFAIQTHSLLLDSGFTCLLVMMSSCNLILNTLLVTVVRMLFALRQQRST